MTNAFPIVFLLATAVHSTVLYRLFRTFYERRLTGRLITGLSYLIYVAAVGFLGLAAEYGIVALLAEYVFLVAIVLNYERSMRKVFARAALVWLFCLFARILTGVFFGRISVRIFPNGDLYHCFFVVSMELVTYMAALVVYSVKTVRRKHRMGLPLWLASLFIPVGTRILYAMNLLAKDATAMDAVTSAVLVFLVNVMVFFLYDSLTESYVKIAEAAVVEKEREMYYTQCRMMQESTNELREFRHDIKNQLVGVSELLNSERYEEGKNQLELLTGKLHNKRLFSTTGNISVDSIVNYKLQNAEKEKIRVNTEIAVPSELAIHSSDCITILGNLLDNALTALRQVGEEGRFLNLKVVYDKGCLVVACSNPYVNEIRYENGRIASTKQGRKEHGYGLKNIETVVDQYEGYMHTKHNDGVFTVELLIQVPME